MDTPLNKVWVVNDLLTAIPGTRTFWHYLLEWFNGHWHGESYDTLACGAERAIEASPDKPRVIIRNGTYFQWFTTCHRPVISLIQDITPYHSQARELQINVGLNSNVVVFNSTYTLEHYPELVSRSRIIPLGVNFDLFNTAERPGKMFDVCWVGAGTEVKGWQDLMRVVTVNSDLKFACITKDGATFPASNVMFFHHLPENQMVQIYNASKVGLCTSIRETQHLAGIEMAACGLPIVAPAVGVYHGVGDDEIWAFPTDRVHLADKVREVLKMNYSPQDVRQSVSAQGLSLVDCESRWKALVQEVCND